MTDAPKTDPAADSTADDGGEGAEQHYWDAFDLRVEGLLDKWFEKQSAKVRGSARNGRATLPKMIADLVFGPEKTS
jgi:hypothetical protein